jgi:hypothetical protein
MNHIIVINELLATVKINRPNDCQTDIRASSLADTKAWGKRAEQYLMWLSRLDASAEQPLKKAI